MPPVITDLSATTELQAINAMLAGIGEQPLPPDTELTDSGMADVAMAVELLRDTTRTVLTMGWRFNTDIGFGLLPDSTYDWVDIDGVTTKLNIFVPPAGLAAFSVQKIPEQLGSRAVGVELRPPRKAPAPAGGVVFYDRIRSRDGLPADQHPALYINPIWYMDFEQLPQTARDYIVAVAGRTFVQSAVGSTTLDRFTDKREQLALRQLKREFGMEDEYLTVPALSLHAARGGRRTTYSGAVDPRRNRNSV